MPKQKELGRSVVLNLSIKVVKTEDVRKILPATKKDPNMEVKGLPGITWNNSGLYHYIGKEAMLQKIINMSEAIAAGKPDFLVLKIEK